MKEFWHKEIKIYQSDRLHMKQKKNPSIYNHLHL